MMNFRNISILFNWNELPMLPQYRKYDITHMLNEPKKRFFELKFLFFGIKVLFHFD